jgi:hypothetical protein
MVPKVKPKSQGCPVADILKQVKLIHTRVPICMRKVQRGKGIQGSTFSASQTWTS